MQASSSPKAYQIQISHLPSHMQHQHETTQHVGRTGMAFSLTGNTAIRLAQIVRYRPSTPTDDTFTIAAFHK
eukprot:scaffold143611_cov18-Prasinocladus_malaysianus.AAC.1